MVAKDWIRTNPESLYNFTAWVQQQVIKKNIPLDYILLEREFTGDPYSPQNCMILDVRDTAAWKAQQTLSDDDVIEIRRLVKSNSKITVQQIADDHDKELLVISQAIRGVTHTHLNSIEAPYVRRANVCEEH